MIRCKVYIVKKIFILSHIEARTRAAEFCHSAPEGQKVVFSHVGRTSEQNEKFHAICEDISMSGFEWMGKPRNAAQWKVLLVSGHSVATKEGAEVVCGLEGEFVNIRESTALMSKKRGSSLIEYSISFCAVNNIKLSS